MWQVLTTLVISLSSAHVSHSSPDRLRIPRYNDTVVLPRYNDTVVLPKNNDMTDLSKNNDITDLSILLLGLQWVGNRDPSSSQSPVAELFPPAKVSVPPLPYQVSYGVSGWLEGSAVVCGGADVATRKFVKSCYSLSKEKGWIEGPPMIQERFAASSAIVEISGRDSLWALGGTDTHDHGLSSTSILTGGKWVAGPEMTGVRAGQCSLPVSPTSVLVTGGLTANGSTTLVEMFSFTTKQWISMPSLQERRERHVCTQVWLAPGGEVVEQPGPHDVMGVVVAGGDAYKDASEHSDPVSSVEMLVEDSWMSLPDLPLLERGRMSRPSGLNWVPGRGLLLLGGCWINLDTATESCTDKVWKLEGGKGRYVWALSNQTLDEPLVIGNSDLLVPSNYFTSHNI